MFQSDVLGKIDFYFADIRNLPHPELAWPNSVARNNAIKVVEAAYLDGLEVSQLLLSSYEGFSVVFEGDKVAASVECANNGMVLVAISIYNKVMDTMENVAAWLVGDNLMVLHGTMVAIKSCVFWTGVPVGIILPNA